MKSVESCHIGADGRHIQMKTATQDVEMPLVGSCHEELRVHDLNDYKTKYVRQSMNATAEDVSEGSGATWLYVRDCHVSKQDREKISREKLALQSQVGLFMQQSSVIMDISFFYSFTNRWVHAAGTIHP